MSAGLIKHLKRKTEEDSNTRILMSQWEFDEKLVGKSLENVGSYYPHFSSHNESHSQQILVNIERLLGNNIEKLTATDTWLILEAAYWHDIGMLFNADEVQKVFEEDDFKEYVESLANDNTQDLHEFAKVWHEDGWNKALVNHSDPHTGVEKYRQMIAEWYRRGHAKNSNSVVLDPFEKLGISSPRTELLPKRIYRYLGQICWAHGLGFEDYVMKTLPFRQTGMGTENCHPRFVACLLRLGDLFDIDDNRFCPVMARQVGNMPSFSETHKHKHQAIREFQLDNETVSVTAVCSTEMAYIECRNWFNWIREEIQNQMSQWKNIVPSRDFGLLPTINKLDVEMDDSKILLDGKPMKFTLDEKNVIELLQGNNLYHGVEDVVRELIQNAIDATLLKVWIDFRNNDVKRDILESGNPYDNEVHEILKHYSISISSTLIHTTPNYENIWRLCIEDHGTGISLEDLKYMQYMGGSDKNLKKKKITRGMPQWMQPSGAFGIGMHSVFLLSKDNPDKYQYLYFSTKSIFSHESIEIKLHSPLSKDNGYCFISCLDDNNEYIPYGTTTEIFLKTDLAFSPEMDKSDTIKARQFLSTLANSMSNTFSNNFLEIIFKDVDFKKDIPNPLPEIKDNYKPTKNIAWFDYEKYSFAIQLYIPDTLCSTDFDYETMYSFRGQEIPIYRNSMDFVHTFNNARIYIDIYGNAKDFLNISRNDWKSYDLIYDIIDNVKKIFENKNMNQKNKRHLIYGFDYNKDLGLNILRKEINSIGLQDNDISNLKVDEKAKLNEIINEKLIILGKQDLTKKITQSFERDGLFDEIKPFNSVNDIYYDATINYFMNNGFSVYKVAFSGSLDNYDSRKILFLYKTEFFSDIKFGPGLYIDDFNVAVFTLITEELLKNESHESNFVSEYKFLDEINRCENILEDNTIYIKSNYDDYHLFYSFKDLEIPIPEHYSLYTFYSEKGIIFPFYFENNNIKIHDLEKLYKFVKSKSIDSTLTVSNIKNKYKKLISLIESLTNDNCIWNDFFSNNDF